MTGSRVWVVAGRRTPTNVALVAALRRCGRRARMVEPGAVDAVARVGDVALGRLDVQPTLDGVEPGLGRLRRVEGRGVRVVNRAEALLACHDKLQTALRLGRLGIPQPATAHIDDGTPLPRVTYPVVVKPRFGSWGADVVRCETPAGLERCLRTLRRRPWFRRQGALLQELIPPTGVDLRVIVAGGRVVGAIERVAAAGEWRTNIALGGSRRRVVPPEDACGLAVEAAQAVGIDLVGVDLLPAPGGGWVVLELNGAVDFTAEYSLAGSEVFDEAAASVAAALDSGRGAAVAVR